MILSLHTFASRRDWRGKRLGWGGKRLGWGRGWGGKRLGWRGETLGWGRGILTYLYLSFYNLIRY